MIYLKSHIYQNNIRSLLNSPKELGKQGAICTNLKANNCQPRFVGPDKLPF